MRVLEASGCIRTEKRGRVRMCTLERASLAAVDSWLAEERAVWEGRTDRLEEFVTRVSAGEDGRAGAWEGE